MKYFPERKTVSRRLRGGARRARAAGNWSAPIHTIEMLDKLRQRCTPHDELRCYICGLLIDDDGAWQLEHLDPIAHGGAHVLHNLEAACTPCNSRKGALPLDVFTAARGPLATELVEPLRLTARPVEELWWHRGGDEAYRRLARRVAYRPRSGTEVIEPTSDSLRIGERKILRFLLEQDDPYQARTLDDLQTMLPGGQAMSNQWTHLMGVPQPSTKSPSPTERRRPHQAFMPVRVPTDKDPIGSPGLRLRHRLDPASIARRVPTATRGLRDRDEDPLPLDYLRNAAAPAPGIERTALVDPGTEAPVDAAADAALGGDPGDLVSDW
jgi:hypothetical protein